MRRCKVMSCLQDSKVHADSSQRAIHRQRSGYSTKSFELQASLAVAKHIAKNMLEVTKPNIAALVQDYLQENKMNVPVEVETRSLEEVRELLDLQSSGMAKHVTRIMLDNMAIRDKCQPGKHYTQHFLDTIFPPYVSI